MALKQQQYLLAISRKPYIYNIKRITKALSDNEQGSSSNQAMASHHQPSQQNEMFVRAVPQYYKNTLTHLEIQKARQWVEKEKAYKFSPQKAKYRAIQRSSETK